MYVKAAGFVIFNNCEIDNNEAGEGGGIQITTAKGVQFNNCNLHENKVESFEGGASLTAGGYGGAVNVNSLDDGLDFVNTQIHLNSANFAGGAVRSLSSDMTFTSSTVHDNVVYETPAWDTRNGGGINAGSDVSHVSQGGGIQIDGGVCTLTLTKVHSNTAKKGANISPLSGILYYRLPVVDGHWLPDAKCQVSRPLLRTCRLLATIRSSCACPLPGQSGGLRPRCIGRRLCCDA